MVILFKLSCVLAVALDSMGRVVLLDLGDCET